MTPERWQQIEALFDAVADLSVDERRGRLDDACSEDDELRAEVESLLAALEGAPTRIHEVIGQQAVDLAMLASTSPGLGAARIDEQLGRYRLLEKLGEGGMGVVFLAERVDGEYRTNVAIKLLRGLETREAVSRFRDERQILATLEHPGIVRLLDGGSTDSGQPYLVMEYVDGVPISSYVAQQRLSLHERLELFNRAAAAVAFAHQRLVVHRDLKPSNILVTRDGAPKLLDFGIAKLLVHPHESGVPREASTRTGMQLLTPEYASPEQVRGQPISTATDVYSLGAVLYELCTETKAQRVTGESVEQILDAILHAEPPRPSTVAPAAWRRALRGDLDNIFLKALHKQPEQRYASVEQLIEDIERHLDGLPVKARAPTLSYRAGKFVRRNLVSLAAASVVLATLISATIVSARQAQRADEQAANAQLQRQLAETQTTHAREQAAVARARAKALRDTLRIGAAQQAQDDPTLAMLLLREVESSSPAQLFGWLRAVPHFAAPAFVTTALLLGDSAWPPVAAWSPDGTRVAAARPDGAVQIWAADGTLLAALEGEPGRAYDVAWSPDGEHLVTGSRDASARVWKADGTLVAALDGHALTGLGVKVGWSPDGSQISTASTDKRVRLWRLDGTLLATLDGHRSSEIWARWSPDGRHVVTGSPWDPSVRVWRSDGTLMTTIVAHHEGIRVAAWSPDGEAIVTGAEDGSARVWRIDGSLQTELDRHDARIAAAAWSPDGSRIALGSKDGLASVWEADGELVTVLEGHDGAVIDVQWRADGREIATASEDRTARVWQPDGVLVGVLVGHRQPLRTAAWRPGVGEGSQLLTTSFDGSVRIWQRELNLPRTFFVRSDALVAAAWSPDRSKLATAAEDRAVHVWQLDGTRLATLAGLDVGVASITWSPDGQWLLTTHGDSTTRVWRADGTLLATLTASTDELISASLRPIDTGLLIATAHADGSARVWQQDGTLRATLTGHSDAVRSIAWSPDGQRLLTASWDATARVWTADGTSLVTLTGHEQAVQAAAWSPDGTHIATASMDHTARIWRSDGTLVAVLEGHAEMESVTWSPDGTRLVTTSLDHVARYWRADGAPISTLTDHEGEITSVVWSRDSTRLLTTTGNGIDGAARVWSEQGLLLATIPHAAGIASGTFGPADTHVLAAGRDGNVQMWLVDAAQLLRGFWLSTPRCLDAVERQRVLAETLDDAVFGETTCRAMQACLRDHSNAIEPERFEPCMAELHASRDAHDR